jgi:hypothetical protein
MAKVVDKVGPHVTLKAQDTHTPPPTPAAAAAAAAAAEEETENGSSVVVSSVSSMVRWEDVSLEHGRFPVMYCNATEIEEMIQANDPEAQTKQQNMVSATAAAAATTTTTTSDMTQLQHLHEASLLHTLHKRFSQTTPLSPSSSTASMKTTTTTPSTLFPDAYTWMGSVLVATNPLVTHPDPDP